MAISKALESRLLREKRTAHFFQRHESPRRRVLKNKGHQVSGLAGQQLRPPAHKTKTPSPHITCTSSSPSRSSALHRSRVWFDMVQNAECSAEDSQVRCKNRPPESSRHRGGRARARAVYIPRLYPRHVPTDWPTHAHTGTGRFFAAHRAVLSFLSQQQQQQHGSSSSRAAAVATPRFLRRIDLCCSAPDTGHASERASERAPKKPEKWRKPRAQKGGYERAARRSERGERTLCLAQRAPGASGYEVERQSRTASGASPPGTAARARLTAPAPAGRGSRRRLSASLASIVARPRHPPSRAPFPPPAARPGEEGGARAQPSRDLLFISLRELSFCCRGVRLREG